MSMGGLVGAVVGGIVGFFIAGPTGAFYGASIGFSLGMMIDPMTPDMPSTGAPLPMAAEIMSTTVGDPLPDLVGTVKITGHLLCYGKERTKTVYAETESAGKGGPEPEPQITGYEYYMSWAVGIAAGPVNTVYAIYRGDDVVWEGVLDMPTDPDDHGQETILLTGFGPPSESMDGHFDDVVPFGDPPELPEGLFPEPSMGSATFYFGTDNQVVNSAVGDMIGDATLNSPYRNLCWCFFDDCYIGSFNRCPTMKFVVRKSPEIAFSENNVIQLYDYNPMHAAWYILHDLSGLPETWLNTVDFAAAAATLANENRGISCLFMDQQSTLNYLGTINNHIDGIIRYGSDGEFHPKLIRDDYNVDDLPLVDESVMIEDPSFERKSWIDTINEVKVQYTEIISQRGCTIYNLFASSNDIVVIYYDGGNSLTVVGSYVSVGTAVNDLLVRNSELIAMGGSEDTAELLRIGSTPYEESLPLLESYPIANQYDVVKPNTGDLSYDIEEDRLFYVDTTGVLVRFNTFDRDVRGYYTTVTVGTDNNLYVASYVYTGWVTTSLPITGIAWSTYWDIIPDGICDSHISTWGEGVCHSGGPANVYSLYYNDRFYVSLYDSPNSYIRKFNPDTLELESYVLTSSSRSLKGGFYRIFTVEGALYTRIKSFDSVTLAVFDSVIIPGMSGVMEIVGNKLIVITKSYAGGDCGIFRINPYTLDIEGSYLFEGAMKTELYQTISAIGETHVAVGRNSGISVFNINTLGRVADTDINDYGYSSKSTVCI